MPINPRPGSFANIKGLENLDKVKVPLKLVIYEEVRDDINIILDLPLIKIDFKLNLADLAKKLTKKAVLVILPKEIKSKMLIRRIAEAGKVPVAKISLSQISNPKPPAIEFGPFDWELINNLYRTVSGKVIRRNPETGEECGVPGAKVTVLDVDINLAYWMPHADYPMNWVYPFHRTSEKLTETTTDLNGNFSVNLFALDLDVIATWRKIRFCEWVNIKIPTVYEAIDFGIKPDIRFYPELPPIPDLIPLPKPEVNIPTPVLNHDILELDQITNNFQRLPKFSWLRKALEHQKFFTGGEIKLNFLQRKAFPDSIEAPALPSDEALRGMGLSDQVINEMRRTRPYPAFMRCWETYIPGVKTIPDVPDITFKVEQEIDGVVHNIYDDTYLNINWNLTGPTQNIVLEANEKAVTVGCGLPEYTPCTGSGLVGINELAITPMYINSDGYATKVNIPAGGGAGSAKSPFCGNLRLVGCPGYGQASYYKVFYKFENQAEVPFMEKWHIYNIGSLEIHTVQPDANGFYPVLNPPQNYFPYHTIINWPTWRYPNGRYTLRLALYDANHNIINTNLATVPIVIDNSYPSRVDFTRLRWRTYDPNNPQIQQPWSDPLPMMCTIIERAANTNIELEISYNVAATHLYSFDVRFAGCDGISEKSDTYIHKNVDDNNIATSWVFKVPQNRHEGAYHFYLEARSRAFNAIGGLGNNWEITTTPIRRGNNLGIVILDK